MANAFVMGFESYGVAGLNLSIAFRAVYIGSDIPGGSTGESLTVIIDPTLNASQINAAIVQAVRDFATSRGFTVPNAACIIAAISKA